jgi:hypothetical protein
MNSPQYILSHYINSLTNIDDVNKHLYQTYNIMTKDFPELDMTIYYNKYDSKHKTQIEMASRSVILSKSSHNVICYTCPTPIYNMDAVQYLWRNQDKPRETFLCYEGSLISVFNYNNKWFVASRKNIYNNSANNNSANNNSANNNSANNNIGGQYKMFMDVLESDNYKTFDEFTNKLDKKYSYHFVLIHHENDNIVNYINQFGENYKKLCFIFARDINQKEINVNEIDTAFLSDNIFLPKKIEDADAKDFVSNLSNPNIINKPEYEGIIIKLNNHILKLQSSAYQFHKAIGPEKKIYLGFLSLYQNNSLKNFFVNENTKYKKIVNPSNHSESFDTIGIIDALFKVITSELYYLFYTIWNDNGEHLNKELYSKLPKEYKDILYHIKGIYYTNKTKHIEGDDDPILKLKNIYNFIKSIDTHILEHFIRCRKLMLNWVRLEKSNNTELFNKTLHHSEKVYYKLAAIYTTKLFPEIMPDDLPKFESNN